MSVFRRWAAVAAGILLLAGCQSSPPPPKPESPFEPVPGLVVPLIPAPLNTAKFKADPCTAISAEQLDSLGFETGKQEKDPDLHRCDTFLGRASSNVGAWYSRYTATISDNLTLLYSAHARGHDTGGNHWEEITVSGYPAVIVDVIHEGSPSRDRGTETCTLALGADDTTLISLMVNANSDPKAGPYRYDACAGVKKVAEVVVDNLRS